MAIVTLNDGRCFTSAELRNPETSLGLPSFCDWRVFAVPHNYHTYVNGPVYGPDSFDAHQPHEGPAYIVVGADVTDDRLQRNLPKLRERYSTVTLAQLQAARAGEFVMVRLEPTPAHRDLLKDLQPDRRPSQTQ